MFTSDANANCTFWHEERRGIIERVTGLMVSMGLMQFGLAGIFWFLLWGMRSGRCDCSYDDGFEDDDDGDEAIQEITIEGVRNESA
jgi:hypothetical protein